MHWSVEAHRGSRAVDELPVTTEPAMALEKDRTREDTPQLKRYFNE
jgi:hypothetical protein